MPVWGLGVRVGVINVINTWPVKPFETVMVIKGYTNTIELNLIEHPKLRPKRVINGNGASEELGKNRQRV